MELKSLVIKGVRWTSIGTMVTSVFQFLQNVVLARILTPEDFGLMAIVMLVIGLGRPFSDLGFTSAIIQKQELSKAQFSTLYWLGIGIGVFLFFSFYLLVDVFIHFFNYQTTLKPFLKVTFACFLVFPLGAPYAAMLNKLMKFDLLNKITIINAVGTLITALALAFGGFGLWALVGAFVFNAIFQSVSCLLVGWNYVKLSTQFDLKDSKDLIYFGLFETAGNFVNYLSSNVDKMLIGKFLDAHALGLYTLAWNLVLYPVKKINPIIMKVAFPVFSKIQQESKRLSKYYINTVFVLMAVNIPLLFGLAVVADAFLFSIYGPQWVEGAATLSILCLVGLYRSFSNPGGSIILAKGRADLGLYWNIGWSLALVGFMGLFLYLKPSIASVALGQVVASIAFGWVWHLMIAKVGRIDYMPLLKKVGGLLGYALILFVLDYTVNWGEMNIFVGLILEVSIAALLYFIFVYLFFKELINLGKVALGFD